MKKISFLFALLSILLSIGTLEAVSACKDNCCREYWYASMGGGATFRDKEILGSGDKNFLAGPLMDIALGYQFTSHFKMEGALAFRTHPLNRITDAIAGDPLTAEESSFTILLNTVMMGDYCWRVKPYAGWGIGYGDVLYSIHTNELPHPSMTHTKHHSKNFAYQFIGGFSYFLNRHLDLGLEYRFVGISNLKYRSLNSRFQSNDILVKLIYAFRNREQLFNYTCPAFCDPASRYYLTTKAGATFRDTEDYFIGTKAFHVGPSFAAAIGYYPCVNWLRGELEFGFKQNEVKKVRVSGFRATGDEIVLTGMLNGYIEPFSICCFTPYVGGGLGYAYTNYAIHINLPPNPPIPSPPQFPAFKHPRLNSSNFAYQFMGGVHCPISDHTLLGLEYQYFCVKDQEYNSFGVIKIHENPRSHSATLRLTYLL